MYAISTMMPFSILDGASAEFGRQGVEGILEPIPCGYHGTAVLHENTI